MHPMMKSTAIVCFFLSSLGHAAEELKIATGGGIISYVDAAADPFEKSSGIKITEVHANGMPADSVVKSVDSGSAELGLIGNSWDVTSQLLSEKKVSVQNLNRLQSQEIGQAKLVIVTYKGGPKALTKSQIKAAFTGKVTNWKEL